MGHDNGPAARGADLAGGARRVDRIGPWAVGGWLILFLAIALGRASEKPFWYDELFTLHLARLPGVSDLWTALTVGTDLNPPLSYLLVRGSRALLGDTPIAARLPSALGVATLSLCLYLFAARRIRPAYAWVAALVPAVTRAFDYAFEARPYGIVLGLAGLALVCWQRATEGRRGASIALALALAAAVSTHFYAVLIFVPLGLGELARSRSRGRVDARIWCALFAGLIPLLFYGEIIHAARAYSDDFWAKVELSKLFDAYSNYAKDSVIPLFAILAYLLIDARRAAERPGADPARDEARAGVPWHELVAALGFLLLPLIGIALALLATGGAFTWRYAMPGVIGPSLLLAYAGARFGGGRAAPGAVMAAILLGWFLYGELVYRRTAPAGSGLTPELFAPAAESDLPLVVTRSLTFLQADHELPRPLADRLVFLTSKGVPTDDRALTTLARWTPLEIRDFRDFLEAHDAFYAFGSPNDPAFKAILEGGARVTLLGAGRFRTNDAVLARVEMSSPGPPASGPPGP